MIGCNEKNRAPVASECNKKNRPPVAVPLLHPPVASNKKWDRIESFGPKIVENIVQAVSRDILAYAMDNLQAYRIVGHIHDEVIIEAEEDTDVNIVCQIMSQTPPWIPGLLLKAEGYETEWYRKD